MVSPHSARVPPNKGRCWFVLMAPAGVPAEIVTRVNKEVGEFLKGDDLAVLFNEELGALVQVHRDDLADLLRHFLHWRFQRAGCLLHQARRIFATGKTAQLHHPAARCRAQRSRRCRRRRPPIPVCV